MNEASDAREDSAGTPAEDVATDRLTDLNPPWTIRNMPSVDRDAAAAAAKRAKKSVAVWVGEAIRSYVAIERGNGASYGEVLPPRSDLIPVPAPATLPDPIARLERLAQIARAATPGKDSKALQEARRQAYALLRGSE